MYEDLFSFVTSAKSSELKTISLSRIALDNLVNNDDATIEILVAYIHVLENSRNSTASFDALPANVSVATSFPGLSHVDVWVNVQLSNELCRFHIVQWVRVGAEEPISVNANSNWASEYWASVHVETHHKKPLNTLRVSTGLKNTGIYPTCMIGR